tara:strand:- start:2431 stop:3171 length:741 start_codon:yes stop_codon:yes gene_type:complete
VDFIVAMKAVILCAGYGTRLGQHTKKAPKPMLLVNGKPILEHIIRNLTRSGFNELAVNLYYKPEAIQEYFGSGEEYGVKLTYFNETALLGTAGGVKNMEPFLSEDTSFLVHYGDIVTDQLFGGMLEAHENNAALATILLHKRAHSNSVVSLDETFRVTEFLERPKNTKDVSTSESWVNSGIYIFNKGILGHIPNGCSCDFPRDIFPALVKEGNIYGFPVTGYRCAIDSPERLKEAESALAEGECMI